MSWQKNIGKSLKELRFILCQTNQRSTGLRNYIGKNYWELKGQNPTFPFIVRECENVDPYIIARYDFGVEKKAFIANLGEEEIEKIIKDLVDQAEVVNKAV